MIGNEFPFTATSLAAALTPPPSQYYNICKQTKPNSLSLVSILHRITFDNVLCSFRNLYIINNQCVFKMFSSLLREIHDLSVITRGQLYFTQIPTAFSGLGKS